jgi:hypothetical protein
MDFIPPPQAQDCPEAGDRSEPVERVGLVVLGRVQARQLHGTQQMVVGAEQREVHCEALLHCGIGKALRHASPIGLVGDQPFPLSVSASTAF